MSYYNDTADLAAHRADLLEQVSYIRPDKIRARSARVILRYFAENADTDNTVREISAKTISKALNLSISTVRNQIRLLEVAGYVECIRSFSEDGLHRPTANGYVLTLPSSPTFEGAA